jgi:hypothetical protein
MIENKIEYIANQMKELETFIKSSKDSYHELYERVDQKLEEIRAYAEENEIPFIADVDDLIERNREESSEYEESSSSYYEEESDNNEDEDEEDDEEQQETDDEE